MRKKTLNIKTHHTVERVIDASKLKNESFSATIKALKDNAFENGVRLEDMDIAKAINVTLYEFQMFMKNDTAPQLLFDQLRSTYNEHLKLRYYKVSFDVVHPDPLFSPKKQRRTKRD